jgi:hypothetical protein
MNLLNHPSLCELSALIGKCDNSKNYFHLIVDHNGEVLIECSSKKIKELLPKYKFHIHGLHGKAYLGINAANNLRYLNQLYKNLLYCWEKNMAGAIDYDKISNIQTDNYWLKINSIAQPAEATATVSHFFKKEAVQYHSNTK